MSATKNNKKPAQRAPEMPLTPEIMEKVRALDEIRANSRARARRRVEKAARTLGKITMTPEQRGDVDLVVANTKESIAKATGRLLLEEAHRLHDRSYKPEGILKRTKSGEQVYTAHIGFLLLDHPQNAALNYILKRTKENVAPLIRRLFTSEAKRVLAGNTAQHTHAA